MRAAYNQNDLGLYPLDEIYEDPCENCIFLPLEKSTCVLADFGEDNFDELHGCWNGIFIPEPLSNIFEL
jgi:hypothetical protein